MRTIGGRCSLPSIVLLAVAVGASINVRASGSASPVPSQMAAAAYVQEWGQILWGLVTSQIGAPPVIVGDPVQNPDGSWTDSYAAPDGTRATYTVYLDGSALIEILLPDGTSQVMTQSPLSFDGVSKTTINWSFTSSDGLSVQYTTVQDDRGTAFDISDDILQTSGTSVLPDGTRQTFSAVAAEGQTDVESIQSDGSTFTLSVPMTAPEYVSPDLTQDATGTYTDPSFTVSLTLSPTPANPSRWAAFLCDMGDGTTGIFGLNSDFSGFGQVEQTTPWGSEVVALVSWTRGGDVEVYSLDGENIHMSPSAAALDFLRHRWETLTAFFAPAPGAAALSLPRPRASRPSLRETRPGAARPPLSARDRRDIRRRPRP